MLSRLITGTFIATVLSGQIAANHPPCQEPLNLVRHFGADNSPNDPCDVDAECDCTPWYAKHKTYEQEEEEDVASNLEQSTMWPAEREDFSDALLR